MSKPLDDIHFSIDDVFRVLVDVSEGCTPLSSHPFFLFLEEIHERFGIITNLYLFTGASIGDKFIALKDIPDRVVNELGEFPNLRYGPHGKSYFLPPYMQTKSEKLKFIDEVLQFLNRIPRENCLTEYLRFHYFSECHDIHLDLQRLGFQGLFLTDKSATSYHCSDAQIQELRRSAYINVDDFFLITSMLRIENYTLTGNLDKLRRDAAMCWNRYGFVTLFTHEEWLTDKSVQKSIIEVFEAAEEWASL